MCLERKLNGLSLWSSLRLNPESPVLHWTTDVKTLPFHVAPSVVGPVVVPAWLRPG